MSQGQGEGPDDSKSERSEGDDGVGRGRSERSERSSSCGRTPRRQLPALRLRSGTGNGDLGPGMALRLRLGTGNGDLGPGMALRLCSGIGNGDLGPGMALRLRSGPGNGDLGPAAGLLVFRVVGPVVIDVVTGCVDRRPGPDIFILSGRLKDPRPGVLE